MKFTIKDFRKRFPDDDACLAELMRLRYGDVSECPECHKQTKFHRVAKRRCYECQWCGYQVYPTQGTPFEKTTTPLSSWFYVIYLMTATRSGVAAKEVERQLGVTYKTAWRMCHQIRLLMGLPNGSGPLSGHVEADETLIGGVNAGQGQANYMANKTTVFGMVERGGRVIAGPIPNRRAFVLERAIERNVEKGSTISTDEWVGYNNVGPMGYRHGTVNHSKDQWVSGTHHTNSIEGFWSRLKVSIRGTHVHVSRKHLHKYVDEFAFRYNHRAQPATMFDAAPSSVRPPRGATPR